MPDFRFTVEVIVRASASRMLAGHYLEDRISRIPHVKSAFVRGLDLDRRPLHSADSSPSAQEVR